MKFIVDTYSYPVYVKEESIYEEGKEEDALHFSNLTELPAIKIDDDALDKLDDYIKGIYSLHIEVKEDTWGDSKMDIITPESLMIRIKPIAKAFGLYPYNQEKVRNP